MKSSESAALVLAAFSLAGMRSIKKGLWVCVFLCVIAVSARGQTISWTRQFGTTADDVGRGVAVDATGVYVFGLTFGALPSQVSAGGIDAFLRKYDTNGTELWTRQFGTSSFEVVYGVAADATGVYAVGEVAGALPGQTHLGERDAYVRKYDTNGTELWTRQFGTTTHEFAFGVLVEDGTGVYVVGLTYGALPGYVNEGSADAYVRKYDTNGTELWTRQFGTSEYDAIFSVAADATGIYVVGHSYGALFDETSEGSGDAFVRKYDTSGSVLWTHQFGTSGDDAGQSITADANGVYAVGFTGGGLAGQTHVGANDGFLRKYDASGNELWTRQFGTSTDDSNQGVAVKGAAVYVSGLTGGTLPGQTSTGSFDAYVRKYDTNGIELWSNQFGSPAFDGAFGVAADASGIYAGGVVGAALPGQTSAGGQDAFLTKIADQASTQLDSLSPGTFWIGLKNSDDQGTSFDLRVELYKNDALVSAGQALCITGVTRNANLAKQVTAPFDPVSGVPLASGDVLSLKVLTRIGTNPDSTKCPGHANAVGLRLYYDAATRASSFGAEITPDPLQDFFLHTVGGTSFFDGAIPTSSTAKFKDSAAIKFAGGNLWKEISTWIRTQP